MDGKNGDDIDIFSWMMKMVMTLIIFLQYLGKPSFSWKDIVILHTIALIHFRQSQMLLYLFGRKKAFHKLWFMDSDGIDFFTYLNILQKLKKISFKIHWSSYTTKTITITLLVQIYGPWMMLIIDNFPKMNKPYIVVFCWQNIR
jgi:hypothetical protein